LLTDPVAEIFVKNTFKKSCLRNLVLEENRPHSQAQFPKLKDFNKKLKLHKLERFFFRGRNYLMHDPRLYGKGRVYGSIPGILKTA
jgi:hypothetical protein